MYASVSSPYDHCDFSHFMAAEKYVFDISILQGYSMDVGDKSLMDLRRSTDEYIHGINHFLGKAFERASQGDEILCPCKKCFNRYLDCRNVVEDHLICHGFVHGYTKLVCR